MSHGVERRTKSTTCDFTVAFRRYAARKRHRQEDNIFYFDFFLKLRHPRGEEVTTLSRYKMSALSHETVVQNPKKMAAKAQKLFDLLDVNDDGTLVRVWI